MLTRSDQIVKQLLRACLEDGGTFTPSLEVSPDPQQADGYFVPNPDRSSPVLTTLLGRMTELPCSFEVFTNVPNADELTDCVRKHLNLRHILRQRGNSSALPRQWIISSGWPRRGFGALKAHRAYQWPQGIYELPSALATFIVVASDLPRERSTLLLRLMGRGKTLQGAIAELKDFSKDDFERCVALPILVRFRITSAAESISSTDEELNMYATELREFLRDYDNDLLQRGELIGLQRGQLDGRRATLLRQLRRKFGELPDTVIARVESADTDALDQCAEKLLFANRIEEVFDGIL